MAQQTEWTRQQVEERYERATGEAADPQATSTDLWAWANEAYAIEPCPECGAADMEYGQHEPGCPSGYPTREAPARKAAHV